ncbi:MAG: radical SAM protein [Myxococcaceae bacterium]
MDGAWGHIEEVKRLIEAETGTLRVQAPLKVALCYPSPYQVGMSSLGFQTIYREANAHPGACAERAFLPEDVEGYRRTRTPLFTFESLSPVSSFPVVAFSVAYELELAGLITVLELSGLPPLRADRGESHPLIVAGGPLTFSNPEPLEPFVDLVVQGEADGLIHELLEAAKELPRFELLEHFKDRQGFRVPGRSGPNGRFHVTRAPVDKLPARSQILTPHTELRSMFLVEPERGCSRGCHYCVLRRTTNGGMRTFPAAEVLKLVPSAARRVGLVGAAVTDHPEVSQLIEALVASGREVGVSSLRADRLNKRLVEALRSAGAKVLTVASDGASQRLRDRVDRKHSEQQILTAAGLGRAAGMERLKVYTIVGLPTEEDGDIDELVRFTVELSKVLPVALGVAPFVAKRHTPLDGSPFAGIKEVERRLERLRRGVKGKAVVRPTSARWAWVEYMLAQSGPEAGLAVLDAVHAGGSFAAWKRAFEERGVQPFLAARVEDDRRKPMKWPTLEARSP